MLKSALLLLSALFISNSSSAFTLTPMQCPPGFTHSVENDSHGNPKKICCTKNEGGSNNGGGHNNGGSNNGGNCNSGSTNGGSCNGGGNNNGHSNGGHNGGGHNNGGGNGCVQVPNCKVEPGPGQTLATASNSNSKCRKTTPAGVIIPGDTCDGSWFIQNGKCCFMTR